MMRALDIEVVMGLALLLMVGCGGGGGESSMIDVVVGTDIPAIGMDRPSSDRGLDAARDRGPSGSDVVEPADAVVVEDGSLADLPGPVDMAMAADLVTPPDLPAGSDLGGSDLAPAPDNPPTLGRGQCYQNGQCPTGDCNEEAAGGICLGCGSEADCPDTFDACVFGACSRSCSDDADCVVGTSCQLSQGACGLKRCTTSADCSTLHTCRALTGGSSLFCQRVLCSAGCPSGTTCQGSVCVEDSLAF
jgi:hypothetical protein